MGMSRGRRPSRAELPLPLPLAKVVLKALAKGPDARYLSASGLLADLLECRAQWRSTGAIERFEPGRYDAKGVLRVSRRLYGRERDTAVLVGESQSRPGRPPRIASGHGRSRRRQVDISWANWRILSAMQNGRFVTGKFDQYKRNVPYLALIQALQQLIGQLLSETKDELEAWRSRILTARRQQRPGCH